MKKTTYLFLAYLWATLAVIQAQDKTKELFEELLQNTSSLEVVKELVKAGANPQATFQKEGSWAYMMKPLHIAAASQNLELVKYFVSKGANIHEFVKYPASFTANTQTHNRLLAKVFLTLLHLEKGRVEVSKIALSQEV